MLRKREEELDLRRNELAKARLGEARAVYAKALVVECEFWRYKSIVR